MSSDESSIGERGDDDSNSGGQYEEELEPEDLVSSDSDSTGLRYGDDAKCPHYVRRIAKTESSDNTVFKYVGATDWCGCKEECGLRTCLSAVTGHYCTSRSCRIRPTCGNRLRDTAGLRLGVSMHGRGVFSSRDIERGTLIGEYSGDLSEHDHASEETPISDYVFELQGTTLLGTTAYIDARDCGGIA